MCPCKKYRISIERQILFYALEFMGKPIVLLCIYIYLALKYKGISEELYHLKLSSSFLLYVFCVVVFIVGSVLADHPAPYHPAPYHPEPA